MFFRIRGCLLSFFCGIENGSGSQKERNKNLDNKKITILGFSIWRILAYFIIYSVVGYVIETLFGIVSKGLWESRQSFLYGPFCAIYGLGAVIMILFLQYFNKNNNRLFWGGFLIGSIVEYTLSLIGEIVFHAIWWDYSNMPLNINGRICVFYSLFWGFLAIYLITYLNPKVDRLIDNVKNKFSMKTLKRVTMGIIMFMAIDFIITGWATNLFVIRMVGENDLNVAQKDDTIAVYNYIYRNYNTKWLADFVYEFWGDRKMIRTFPNLKVQDVDGNIIYLDSLLPEIQPYYYKVFDKEFN